MESCRPERTLLGEDGSNERVVVDLPIPVAQIASARAHKLELLGQRVVV